MLRQKSWEETLRRLGRPAVGEIYTTDAAVQYVVEEATDLLGHVERHALSNERITLSDDGRRTVVVMTDSDRQRTVVDVLSGDDSDDASETVARFMCCVIAILELYRPAGWHQAVRGMQNVLADLAQADRPTAEAQGFRVEVVH